MITRQGGTSESETFFAADSLGDGDVVVAGNTCGSLQDGGGGGGGCDFAAMKLDKDGNDVWQWQV